MSDITINIKSNTDNIERIKDVVRPSIDKDNICITDDNITIYNCEVDQDNNIKGYTEDNKRALYKYSDNMWYFGRDISKLNLIDLSERTKAERLEIIRKSHEKQRENIEQKKNFNELAKAVLDQVLSDKQIKNIVGDDPNFMVDNTVGSAILNSMINTALNGSFKAAEFLRDTAGYKPKNEVELQADIMTEADRSLIDKALKTS